jgi:hypothetical protein
MARPPVVLGGLFLVVVAALIGWFILDRPVAPGDELKATVVSIKALPQVSGPAMEEVTLKLESGEAILIKAERGAVLNAGQQVTVRRLKRRLTGVASYELWGNAR